MTNNQSDVLDCISYLSWVSAGMFGAMTTTSVACDLFLTNQQTVFTPLNMFLASATAVSAGVAATVANLKNTKPV